MFFPSLLFLCWCSSGSTECCAVVSRTRSKYTGKRMNFHLFLLRIPLLPLPCRMSCLFIFPFFSTFALNFLFQCLCAILLYIFVQQREADRIEVCTTELSQISSPVYTIVIVILGPCWVNAVVLTVAFLRHFHHLSCKQNYSG